MWLVQAYGFAETVVELLLAFFSHQDTAVLRLEERMGTRLAPTEPREPRVQGELCQTAEPLQKGVLIRRTDMDPF